jgi:biopolymer transport protein ExbD
MAGFTDEQDEDDVIAQINIIPFVDISLVLLIIFMLTASIIAKADIPVDLPSAANGNDVVDPTLNIVVTATGDLFVDGAPVAANALGAEVHKRFEAEPKLRAVIAADKSVRYEHVVHVIDVIKSAGVSAFALNIERTP